MNAGLDRLHARLSTHQGTRFLCLATTANVNNPPLHVGSTRLTDSILAGNIIFRDINLVSEVLERFDSLISTYFIDCEIKSGIDISASAAKLIDEKRRHFFKPNDFTVEAADEWMAQRIPDLRNSKIAIVGAGNIGIKLGIRLAERGSTVRLVGRRPDMLSKIVAGLNQIKRGSGTLVACETLSEAVKDVASVIGCTPGNGEIGLEAVEESAASFMLDIGNGCFSSDAIALAQERNISIEVLSPTAGWSGYIRRYLATQSILKGLGRREIETGVWLVSQGVMGRHGDILVDDVWCPTRVIGVCNGNGDLLYGEVALDKVQSMEIKFGLSEGK